MTDSLYIDNLCDPCTYDWTRRIADCDSPGELRHVLAGAGNDFGWDPDGMIEPSGLDLDTILQAAHALERTWCD
jgi:hypothetical protein